MSDLNIDKLNEEVELSKTAEEAEMEKIAHVVNVVEQSQILTSVGEELYKIACEVENEGLAALAADIYQTGERMGACLSKTASEGPDALVDAMEIAEDLNKIATVFAELADDVQDETLTKMAEAVVDISNEMTEEANEVMEAMSEGEGEVEKEAEENEGYKAKRIWKSMGIGAGTGGGIGALLGLLAKKNKGQAAAIGALIGSQAGMGLGNIASRIKQSVEHNKRGRHKHPILRSFTPTSAGEMNRATSTSEHLKALNLGGAAAGGIGRFIHKKK